MTFHKVEAAGNNLGGQFLFAFRLVGVEGNHGVYVSHGYDILVPIQLGGIFAGSCFDAGYICKIAEHVQMLARTMLLRKANKVHYQ